MQPDNTVQQPVPDIRVRHYFIRNDDPAKARETRALVRRLQRMDVRVARLTRSLTVPDFKPYGRAARSEVLPSGTYAVAMGQRQKHWIQAMLNEDTYTPFPYFYDVTAWSQPLLFNVRGGYSARPLREMRTAPVRRSARPGRGGGAAGTAQDRGVLHVAHLQPGNRVLGLAAVPAGPLEPRVPGGDGRGRQDEWARRRGSPPRARRLRDPRPGRPGGPLRLGRPRR